MKHFVNIAFILIMLPAIGQDDCIIKDAYTDIFNLDVKHFGKRTYLTKSSNKGNIAFCNRRH